MIIAVWNCMTLPLEIAFEPESLIDSWIYNIGGYLIDVFFFLDIIAVFRTTISSEEDGSCVMDPKQIGLRYLKGDFSIDLLATIPLDSLALLFVAGESAKRFKLFGILKLVRLMRLNRIIRNLNVRKETKVMLKLSKLIFFLVMWVHCQSCLWFYIIK